MVTLQSRRLNSAPEAYYPGLKSVLREEDVAKLKADISSAEQELASSRMRLADERHKFGDVRLTATKTTTLNDKSLGEALKAADQSTLDAQNAERVNEQQLVAAKSRLHSLQARIAADDAKFYGRGDSVALTKAAFHAEKHMAYEEAHLRATRAEGKCITAGRSAAADAQAAPELEKAKHELSAARAAVDEARTKLTIVGDSFTPLSPIYPTKSTGRRLALAKWIASADNPLTARVAVNHIWLRHFGRGLVETPSNFGRSGRPPANPELLDWLAVELMENGWRMKHIHRLIVTSQAYRRRSGLGEGARENLANDPDNVYHWRANIRRMEAEVVRDSLLTCVGALDATIGGPELDPAVGVSSRRRSVYFSTHGEGKMQFLELFDAPDVCDCYQRTVSVRPQQALALTNSELPWELSRLLAAKLWQEVAQESDRMPDASFIGAAFETILARSPTELELQAALEFLDKQTATLAAASAEELAAKLPESLRPPAKELRQRRGRR